MEYFNKLVGFGNNIGWVANLLALFVIPSSTYMLYKKRHSIMEFFKKTTYNNIEDYIQQNTKKFKQKNRLKIAIIDDEADEFPVSYIRQQGHEVVEYKQISLAEYSSLLSYDIVFLDMIGVIKEDSERGAMELIKKLKSEKNSPYIIAVSKATFDPTVTDYFKKADDVEKKPLTEIKCDSLLAAFEQDASPINCSKKIDSLINSKDVPRKISEKALDLVINLLDEKISRDKFMQKFTALPANIDKESAIRILENILKARSC